VILDRGGICVFLVPDNPGEVLVQASVGISPDPGTSTCFWTRILGLRRSPPPLPSVDLIQPRLSKPFHRNGWLYEEI
jgi:hypothetical protein